MTPAGPVRSRRCSLKPQNIRAAPTLSRRRDIARPFVLHVLLQAFPILAVFAAFKGTRLRGRPFGKVLIGVAAIVTSLAMTAVYHVGYSDFRSDKVQEPLKYDVFWSAPTLFTLNPLGAPVTHAGMHVTAVLHSYDTDVMASTTPLGRDHRAARSHRASRLSVRRLCVLSGPETQLTL